MNVSESLDGIGRDSTMDPSPSTTETAPSSIDKQLRDAIDGLRVNTKYLQKPYSDEPAAEVSRRLKAAASFVKQHIHGVSVPHSHAPEVNELLELLNLHLQWYLSTCTVGSASHSSLGFSEHSTNNCSSSNSGCSSRSKALCSKEQASGVALCCSSLYCLLCVPTVADMVKAAVQPSLTAPGSGTMHLLCQAAHYLLQLPAKERSKVAGPFLDAWIVSNGIAYPSSSPAITGSSSAWCTLPHLGQGLLAVVQILNWFMQQPVRAQDISRIPCLVVVNRQLQLLVEGATDAKWVGPPSSSSFPRVGSQPAAPTKETLSDSLGGQALMAVTSGATRVQVERFLWDVLDLATAALQRHTDPPPVAAARTTPTTNTASASSSSSGGGNSRNSWQLGMGFNQAQDIYGRAATALLQLATAEVPAMGAGTRWLPDIQECWASVMAAPDAAADQAACNAYALPLARVMTGRLTVAAAANTSSTGGSPSGTCRQPIGLPPLQGSGRSRTQQGSPAGAGSYTSSRLCRCAAVPQKGKHALGLYLCWPYPDDVPSGNAHTSGSSSSSSSSRMFVPTSGPSGHAVAQTKVNSVGTAAATTASATASSINNSNSSSAATRGVGSLDTPLGQLQLLSTAAYVWWHRVRLSPCMAGASGTLQLLVLLVQRLQGSSPEVFNAFLNSQAGTKVLQVLGSIAEQGLLSKGVGTGGRSQAVPSEQQGTALSMLNAHGDALVGLLLLPGLLLQPTPPINEARASRCKLGLGIDFGSGLPAPLLIVEYNAMRLPPGCIPPPAAFFLVEQLLRGAQTPSAGALAAQLLEDSVEVLAAPSATQQQAKRRVGRKELARQAAAAQLRQLAYCSLATTLVQVAVNNRSVGEVVEGPLLTLCSRLLLKEYMAAAAPKRKGSTRADPWGIAALLAAATGVGASTVHVQLQLDEARKGSATGTSSRQAYAARSSSRAAAAMGGHTTINECPADCSPCQAALLLHEALLKYERGVHMHSSLPSAGRAALQEAARQKGITLQQHLQQQLLALAWRHPVPGVCGNVLCGRLEGASAVGAVRGRVGSLCGGCRAAWYCCKACQRAAWEAHRDVCGRSN